MTYSTPFCSRAFFLSLSLCAVGCGFSVEKDADLAETKQPASPSSERTKQAPYESPKEDSRTAPVTVPWCSGSLIREGSIAGVPLDYPTEPFTVWFNRSLEDVALEGFEKEMMENQGLDPNDNADYRRFRYELSFDLRVVVGDIPNGDNWFSNKSLGIYVYDLVSTGTPPNGTIPVFDASALREARLSGDPKRLGETVRVLLDEMKATPGPKAVIAFAPNRVPESSIQRLFINLFAEDVHLATSGSVTLSNLLDTQGEAIPSPQYPLKNLRTIDVSTLSNIAGTIFYMKAGCLVVDTSG